MGIGSGLSSVCPVAVPALSFNIRSPVWAALNLVALLHAA
jgi:hypothetical protein